MKEINVVIIGDLAAGKTAIFNMILNKKFAQLHFATVGFNFDKKELNDQSLLKIWDLPGDPRVTYLRPLFYSETQIALYCVDLSKQVSLSSIDVIKAEVERFRSGSAKNSRIILVRTMSDLPLSPDNETLGNIAALVGADRYIETSAKNADNNPDAARPLLDMLVAESERQYVQGESESIGLQNSLWEQAVNNLNTNLAGLPAYKRRELEVALTMLTIDMNKDLSLEARAQVIQQFVTSAQAVLKNKFPSTMEIIRKVAAVAIISIMAGLIGFAFCFAVLCTGSGAVLSGVGVGAVVAGGLTAYSLFKAPKEISAVDTFVKEVSNEGVNPPV